jgi:hypothetical protein
MKSPLILIFLIMATEIFASGQKRATLSVSAFVRPAARIEVQSTTAVTVAVTMAPNAEAVVWAAAGSCSSPENAKVLSASGIHHLSFTPEDVNGKNLICLASTDGVLRTSARLPQ